MQFDARQKCLSLVILSDFFFFFLMDERRRDKTNGMLKKCQEAIKMKTPRSETELSPAAGNSVCLSAATEELRR